MLDQFLRTDDGEREGFRSFQEERSETGKNVRFGCDDQQQRTTIKRLPIPHHSLPCPSPRLCPHFTSLRPFHFNLESEWKGIGSFWVGVMAFAAGVSGIYVTQSQASGGVATGFYGFLSLITLVAALVSITLGEGTGERRSTPTPTTPYSTARKKDNKTRGRESNMTTEA